MDTRGTLYLIPCLLGDSPVNRCVPLYNLEIIKAIDHFIVEDLRTAKRFLIKAGVTKPLETISFYVLNEHTHTENISEYGTPLLSGKNMGLLSDAGCPAVADPGAAMVQFAHQKNIQVIPLAGASSILLALMASGLNGQCFTFHGYLPKKTAERIKKLQHLEAEVLKNGSTQLFIEAPYRNDAVMADILNTCRSNTLLCVAADITLASENIETTTINNWKQKKYSFNNRPAVFLLGKNMAR